MKQPIQYDARYPGMILVEFYLTPLKLTVTEIAKKLLISRPNMSAIVNGKAGISPPMALKLAKAFNTIPHYWLNLQSNFELSQIKGSEVGLNRIRALV